MTIPTLVLLPGLDGTGLLFGPLLEALPARVQTIVVSYPGNMPLAYTDLLPLVLRALPTDRLFVLLGESFSGPLAVMVASTHPPGLAGVVLCASFVRTPHPYLPSFLAAIVRPSFLRLIPFFSQAKALLGGHSTSSLRALTRNALSHVAPAVLAGRIREVHAVNVAHQFQEIITRFPVLYLHAQNDLVVPAWNAKDICKVCPDVQVVSIPGPHMLLQASPTAAAEALARFLGELDIKEPDNRDLEIARVK